MGSTSYRDEKAARDVQAARFIDQSYFGSSLRSLEILVATTYPIILLLYFFRWLVSTPEGQDIITLSSATFFGHLTLIIAIAFVFFYTYIVACYICSNDPLLVRVLAIPSEDLSNLGFNKESYDRIKRILSSNNFRSVLESVAGLSASVAIVGHLTTGFLGFLLIFFYSIAWTIAHVIGNLIIELKVEGRKLGKNWFYAGYGIMLLSIIVLFLVGEFPVFFGRIFGTIVVAALCIVAWENILSAVAVKLRSLGKLFFIFILAAIALTFTLTSYLPPLRAAWPLVGESKTLTLSRQAALRKLDQEYHQRFIAEGNSADGKHHIVFVAAAGGGQRAAIWTEAVLRNLQHDLPGFADKIFVISGVSGGSLGAAHFLAENADRDRNPQGCEDGKAARNTCIDQFMETDFLAAPFASALSTDLPSIMFGRSLFTDFFDVFPRRDESLVAAWGRRWKEIRGTNHFNEPFLTLWNRNNPSLIVNTTSEAFGDRVVASNLDLAPVYQRDAGHPSNLAIFDMSLGAAVSLGARFPIVSEAESIDIDGKRVDQIVDGGYFDNFGATAIDQLITFLTNNNKMRMEDAIVIQITNDKNVGAYLSSLIDPLLRRRGTCKQIGPNMGYADLPTLLQPLGALDSVRTARGIYTVVQLAKKIKTHKGVFLHFGLLDYEAPLSWSLSRTVNDKIWAQLSSPCNEVQANLLKRRW